MNIYNLKLSQPTRPNTPRLILRSTLVIAAITAVALPLSVVFRNLGKWISASDTIPGTLDVLFVLSGDVERFRYARELLHKGSAASVLASVPHESWTQRLLHNEHMEKEFTLLNHPCTDTHCEIRYLSSWLSENHPHHPIRLGLLTSPYHAQRTRALSSFLLHNSHLNISIITVPLDRYPVNERDYSRWWRNSTVRCAVFDEAVKLPFDVLRAKFCFGCSQ